MSNPSFMRALHQPYRARLALLAESSSLAATINAAGAARAWWDDNLAWTCDFGRFFPGDAPYATLVFVATHAPASGHAVCQAICQAICVVRAYDEQPASSTAHTHIVHDPALGWLTLTPFPADSKLPGIATVLAQASRPHVVRYRPGKRCTIRFDGAADDDAHFAKLFPDSRGQRLHREAQALSAASARAELDFAVAQSLRWDAATGALWQSQVAGSGVLTGLFSADGPRLAARMGRAAASLPRATLRPQRTFTREAQWQETMKQGKELCRRIPWLAGAVNELLHTAATLHAQAERRPLSPIHGAPHAHQWLVDGEQLGLVDFDGFTLGDPELDVATFISEIDYEKPTPVAPSLVTPNPGSTGIITPVDLNVAFLAGYEAVFGPLDQALLRAYCAQKRLAKALKYAHAIHPEGDIRAEQATGRALVSALGGRAWLERVSEGKEQTTSVMV